MISKNNNKIKINKWILICFISLFTFCKKEEIKNYQTIYPLPYFPVYPGSYWKYNDSIGNISEIKTSDNYMLHSFYFDDFDGLLTDSVYVPFWNGIPVYGYSIPESGSGYSLTLLPLLKEEAGASWCFSGYKWSYDYKVISKDTSIVVNDTTFDNVIVVKKYYPGNSWSPPATNHSLTYYAKNVGLIKEAVVNQVNNDTAIIRAITDYYINN